MLILYVISIYVFIKYGSCIYKWLNTSFNMKIRFDKICKLKKKLFTQYSITYFIKAKTKNKEVIFKIILIPQMITYITDINTINVLNVKYVIISLMNDTIY